MPRTPALLTSLCEPKALAHVIQWSSQGYYASEIALALGLHALDVESLVARLRRDNIVIRPPWNYHAAGAKSARGLPPLPGSPGHVEKEIPRALARPLPTGAASLPKLASLADDEPKEMADYLPFRVDLAEGCRALLADTPFIYCGEPLAHRGGSLCPAHHALFHLRGKLAPISIPAT